MAKSKKIYDKKDIEEDTKIKIKLMQEAEEYGRAEAMKEVIEINALKKRTEIQKADILKIIEEVARERWGCSECNIINTNVDFCKLCHTDKWNSYVNCRLGHVKLRLGGKE